MFADNVGLLPDHMFTRKPRHARPAPERFTELDGDLLRGDGYRRPCRLRDGGLVQRPILGTLYERGLDPRQARPPAVFQAPIENSGLDCFQNIFSSDSPGCKIPLPTTLLRANTLNQIRHPLGSLYTMEVMLPRATLL